MRLNYMEIAQSNNTYRIFSAHGFPICDIIFPCDGQQLADYKALHLITRVLALRYRFIDGNGKSTFPN